MPWRTDTGFTATETAACSCRLVLPRDRGSPDATKPRDSGRIPSLEIRFFPCLPHPAHPPVRIPISMHAATYYAGHQVTDDRREIARGLGRRDPDILGHLIEKYQHRLYRYLMFFTRNRNLADDLFQETWLRIVERGSAYDPRYSFEGWMLRVARNLAIDEMRRKNPAAASEDAGPDEGPFDWPDMTQPSAFDAIAADQDRQMLNAALDNLPAYYREVLTLRFHEGMDLRGIAEVVDRPVETVKSRLRRALHMLSVRLQGKIT